MGTSGSVGNFSDPTKGIYRFLTDDGLMPDATNYEMAVDGTTPVTFYFAPSTDCFISRIMIFVEDDGVWTEEKYAAITAISNGMNLIVERNGATILDLYGGVTIKDNASWARVCHDRQILTIGSGNTMLSARYTFAKSGRPLLLRKGDTLKSTVSDNLSALISQTHMVQGYYI